jgi:hypothetical protein
MSVPPPFDLAQAHQFFAADCFNRAWDFLERPRRTLKDDEQMLLLCYASLWHWTERGDCTDRNLSISYWQLSRVYATLRHGGDALRFAEACLQVSHALPPFYLGYAHEAVARAAMIGADSERMAEHVAEARSLAALVADSEKRSALEKDLESIR